LISCSQSRPSGAYFTSWVSGGAIQAGIFGASGCNSVRADRLCVLAAIIFR
jgi:hypothetical protein